MKHNTEGFTFIVGSSNIVVSRFTYGANKLIIKEWGEGASLTIGSFCSLAKGITIFLGGNHRSDWITTFPFGHVFGKTFNVEPIAGHPSSNGNITIGNDVWIGSNATLMSGITIGHGAIIGANSTVTKNVLPYEIVAGNPARHIKFRFTEEIINQLLELEWWNFSVDIIKEIIPVITQKPDTIVLKNLKEKYRGIK